MQYSRNKKRFINRNYILCRQCYNDLGEVSHLQIFCPNNSWKCYYNHYMQQLANSQPIREWCRKFDKSISFLRSQLMSETRSTSVKYAFKSNASITHESFANQPTSQYGFLDQKISCKLAFCQNYRQMHVRISSQQLMYFRDTHLLIQFTTPRQ